MGLVGVKWFFSPSVPTVAARRVDRLKLLEIEVGDRLEFVGGTASRLPLGRGQWCLVDAMSGNTDLRLSNVTVTFPGWLGQSVGFVVR